VNHSDELNAEVGEIWKRLEEGRLHTDARVRIANVRAARVGYLMPWMGKG
jgi:hypothetical protein